MQMSLKEIEENTCASQLHRPSVARPGVPVVVKKIVSMLGTAHMMLVIFSEIVSFVGQPHKLCSYFVSHFNFEALTLVCWKRTLNYNLAGFDTFCEMCNSFFLPASIRPIYCPENVGFSERTLHLRVLRTSGVLLLRARSSLLRSAAGSAAAKRRPMFYCKFFFREGFQRIFGIIGELESSPKVAISKFHRYFMIFFIIFHFVLKFCQRIY